MTADLAKALSYYRQAADREDAEGMYRLALCYLEGKAVEADPAAARELCSRALESQDLENEGDACLREALEGLMERLKG